MTNKQQARTSHSIGVASDFRVVGYNNENADMDNPRGAIVREIFYLRATDARGNRRAWGAWETEAGAEAAIESAPPVFLWAPAPPEYGSPAWEAYGEAEEIAAERRAEENEEWGWIY